MNKAMMALVVGSLVGVHQAQAQEVKPASSWADKVTLKGDMRFRFETIDQDNKDNRERFRIRARAGVEAKANDELDIVVRLSTTEGGDPVSGNQSLDGGFSRKPFDLDLAYLNYHPEAADGLNLIAGKMENPFVYVRDLIWDGDLNPEGVALSYAGEGDVALHLNAGGFSVEERSSDDDTYLFGGQAALKVKMDKNHLLVGGGYFLYENLEGFAPVADDEDSFGNAVIEDEEGGLTYANGYEISELFAEFALNAGLPVSIYGDYAVNNDADDDDTGYMVGVKLGKTKEPGSFDLDYNYRELEANAVLGAFTDSDFIGGGTDGSGHKVSVGYQIAKNLKGQVTYFMNEIGLEGDSVDYNRLQVDVAAKF